MKRSIALFASGLLLLALNACGPQNSAANIDACKSGIALLDSVDNSWTEYGYSQIGPHDMFLALQNAGTELDGYAESASDPFKQDLSDASLAIATQNYALTMNDLDQLYTAGQDLRSAQSQLESDCSGITN